MSLQPPFRFGMRLVKDVLHPQMVRVQGEWYGWGKCQDLSKISDQLRAHDGSLWFAALSRGQGPHYIVPGCRAGEWAEQRMDVEMFTVPFGCELTEYCATCWGGVQGKEEEVEVGWSEVQPVSPAVV